MKIKTRKPKRMKLAILGRKWIYFFHGIYPAKGIRKLEFSGKILSDFYLHGLIIQTGLWTKYRDLIRILRGGLKKELPNRPVFSLFIGGEKLLETLLIHSSCDPKQPNLLIKEEPIKAGTEIKGIIEYPRRKAPLPSKKDNKMTLYLIGTNYNSIKHKR